MNLAWAERWAGDFSAAGLERALDELYTDDVEFEDVTLGKRARSAAELRAFFSSLLGPDAGDHRFTATGYQGDATGGVIEWIWNATHGRDLMGLAAQGKSTQVRGVSER